MSETLVINQFTKDADLKALEGCVLFEIKTQSVFSYSTFMSNGSRVKEVRRPDPHGATFEFEDGNYFTLTNGLVSYWKDNDE